MAHFRLVGVINGRSFALSEFKLISLVRGSRSSVPFLVSRCLSSPRASRKTVENLPNTSNSIQVDEPKPKIVDLAEKPIRSKPVPSVVPSNHVAMFELALQKEKSSENFISVLESFNKSNRPRRGHMDMLRVSIDFMDKFGLEGDLEAYNAMINVFPRGRFENRTLLDAIWPKKHPQVDLALEILTKMEENVVKPSLQTYDLCEEIFGRASQPVQKCRRLAYWFTKLEKMFPHPLPKTLPEDEVELSQLAIARMAKDTIPIITYQEGVKEKGINFIVGSQTMEQKEILDNYDIEIPVYIEGPYFMWIRRLKRHYFILRGHALDKSELKDHGLDKSELYTDSEGAVLAVCMISSHNIHDTLRQWMGKLEEQSPNLAKMKVIFNLKLDELQQSQTPQ